MSHGTAEASSHSLTEGFATLARAAARVRADADPDAIHDARVAARRLSARLDFWRPLLNGRDARRARRRARRLRRALGFARGIEVVLESLPRLAPELPPAAREALATWQLELERERPAIAAAAAAVVTPRRLDRIHNAIADATEGLGERAQRATDLPAQLDRRVQRRAVRARAALSIAFAALDDAALHEARIAIKGWRYALECAHEAERAAPAGEHRSHRARTPRIESLRKLQLALGAIQDLAECRAALERRATLHTPPLREVFEPLESARAAAIERAVRCAGKLESASPD
ncbi:MAG: CHAD domain-containing protein [Candidatus Eisenbacteria bacterium]|uniref:CHAD domain-containing protein n=1 Tax=Eiseniibacteriota bacterium TaxID=2212470 RepID=A0A849STF4_UNCEI|nr:CHAD domain-containing protein [Candidatus Eisenbacteria bacterium]